MGDPASREMLKSFLARPTHMVKSIDVFMSHNWSTPRFSKFLTLALHFEHVWAAVASFVVLAIIMILSGNDYLQKMVLCCHFFMGPNQVVNRNPVGRLLYILVKEYFVIYFYVVKIISNTRSAVNN